MYDSDISKGYTSAGQTYTYLSEKVIAVTMVSWEMRIIIEGTVTLFNFIHSVLWKETKQINE